MQNTRVIKELQVGDDNSVRIRFRGSSNIITAMALEVTRNEQGELEGLLLDRLIHRPGEERMDVAITDQAGYSFNISGCVASELKRQF